MIPSVAPIQGNSNHANLQRSELQSELSVDTLIFNCRRVRDVEGVRQILPSLINTFPGFSENQVRHFQEDVIVQLLKFAEIEEQSALSLMLANWYVTNQCAETRLSSALQAMHYYAKSIQIEMSRNHSVKKLHQEASQLFFGMLDEQHQQKVQKTLNTLANVTKEDLHAFEIFEHYIDQFHCLPHFFTQLSDFNAMQNLFTIATRSLNTVPLERLEKYSGSSEKIERGRELACVLPAKQATERYWEAITNYRRVFEIIDFSSVLTIDEIRIFQNLATENFRAFFKLLIDDALILLGPPPSSYQKRLHQPPCRFEILAMGSLGRKEVCPYSDLEFMIIIENEDASEYFKRLVQILEVQIASLGETSTGNPVFTCIHRKNPSGFHIDSSPSLNSQLIQTPYAMAQLQDNLITEFQNIEYTALRTISLYASEGFPSLFDSYRVALTESLKSCREERGCKFFAWHYADYLDNWKHPFNPNQDIVNIKKQFVVPLYHLLGDMAFYFGISDTNTIDIIEELVKRGCFTLESGKLLQESVAALYAMRMRLHLYYREQKEEASYNSNLSFLTLTRSEIALLEKTYWLIFQPLYGCLGSILKKLEANDTSSGDFKALFKNIDLIPIVFQDKFFDLSESLVKQIALHYCQIKAPLKTHLYYFGALSKHPRKVLRECYFKILETNLNQGDKANILQTLLDIPNQSGIRLAFNRELEELETTLKGMTDKFQGENEMVVVTTPSFTLSRYLKPSIIGKILTGVDIHKMYPGSAHEVCRLEYEGHDLHFKQKPSYPLMEYAIHNLTSRIAGRLTPPNLLVCFDVCTVQGIKSYPVLISKTIPGKNLAEKWKEVEPNASYTWNLICSILTRPGDGRFENYILDDQLNIFCVDNDCSFVELASKYFFSEKNQFCSALFSILKLDTPLDSAVLKEFASLDSYEIILGWIEDVILKEKEYKALFSKEGEIERLFTEDKNNTFSPSILFQKGALANLHLQFWSLQNAIRIAIDKRKTMTSGCLLQELIDLKNESIGSIIHKAYSNHNLPDAKERLKKSTSRTSEKSLNSIQYHDALGIKPSLKQIEKGEYSPEEAKEEFLATVLNSESRYATVKENQNNITIQAQFKRLNNDPEREEKVFLALTQKFKRMSKDIPINLIFNDSHIMTLNFLEPFLDKNVEHLELTNCPTLKNDIISLIQKKCPKLKKLSLTGCVGITEITDSYWSPNFAKLEELDVSNCINLNSLRLDTPLLRILKFKQCSKLKTLENKGIFLLALKEDFQAFLDLGSSFWKDRDVVLAAVKQNGAALQYANASFKKDKSFVLAALRRNRGVLLNDNDDRSRSARHSSKQKRKAIKYVDESLKRDKIFILVAVTEHGLALKYADESLKKDKDVVLAASKQNVAALQYADNSLMKDYYFVLAAFKQNAAALKYADDSLKKNKDFILDVVKKDIYALKYADESLMKDKNFILDVVTIDGSILKYVDNSLKKDKEVILAAVTKYSFSLEHADVSLKKDKEIVLVAVTQEGSVLRYADEELKRDKDVVLAAVNQDSSVFQYVDRSLTKDKDVVLAAVKQNAFSLQYADESFKIDKEVVLTAVTKDGTALTYADGSLKKDKEVVLIAVKQNAFSLRYADKSLKIDKEIVLIAVTQKGSTLAYADDSLKKDKDVVLAAVTRDGEALEYADDSLKKDKDVVLAAFTQSRWALKYADDNLKKDADFVLAAVILNGLALKYADDGLKKDADFVLEAVTLNGLALEHAHESLKKVKRIVLSAVAQNELAFKYADEDLKKDLLISIKQESKALQYTNDNLKEDKDFNVEEFFTAFKNESDYVTVKGNKNNITIQAQFKHLNDDPVRETKVFRALTQKFKRIPKNILIALIFQDSSIMTSDLLAPSLHNNIRQLELTNCIAIKNDTLHLIEENCPFLQKLSLIGSIGITEIGGTYSSPLLNFHYLKELDVSDCSHLQSVKLDAFPLEILRFKNCPNLKIFENKKVLLMAIGQNIEAFGYANATLKKDKEFVLTAVEQTSIALQYVDGSLKKDKEVVLTAITKYGIAFKYADDGLRKDKDFVLAAVTLNGWALQYADGNLKNDKEIVLAAVSQNSAAFKYADDSLKKDKEFILALVKQTSSVLQYVDESLKRDKEVVLAAVILNGLTLQYADENLKKDKDVVLAAVTQSGWALKYADDSLRKDEDFVLAAVILDGLALEYVHEDLKKVKGVVLNAVTQNGFALKYVNEDLKKDKEVVLAAVQQSIWGLYYAEVSLTMNKDFVLAAVTLNGPALQFVHRTLKEDIEVVLAAITQNGLALKGANENFKKNKKVVLAAVTQNGLALQFADASLKQDKEVVLAAGRQNRSALEYAHHSIRNAV